MRDSSCPPSPGSRLGTSCARFAWFVRATLGPRGEPVVFGAGISSVFFDCYSFYCYFSYSSIMVAIFILIFQLFLNNK